MCLIAVGGAHRDHFLQKKLHDRCGMTQEAQFKGKLITSTAIAVKSYLGQTGQPKENLVLLNFISLNLGFPSELSLAYSAPEGCSDPVFVLLFLLQ